MNIAAYRGKPQIRNDNLAEEKFAATDDPKSGLQSIANLSSAAALRQLAKILIRGSPNAITRVQIQSEFFLSRDKSLNLSFSPSANF
ncbi:hypothetical protein HPB48_019697 [Haemaphysalis longicornis]|uniref:Uncharacterized protein n=1 Tax=Haemaphysalis longicornis TaxID=44386 RepID=A0A9J6G4R6_HAELO|nr:hypothetical protein HPB48_019697 [Haemaphysalis longicornis]